MLLFYTARMTPSDNGIDRVEFVATHPWLGADGRPFRPLDVDARPPVVPPDPEGIAVDGRRQLGRNWLSEGKRLPMIPTDRCCSTRRFVLPPSTAATSASSHCRRSCICRRAHGPSAEPRAGGPRPHAERAVSVGSDGGPGYRPVGQAVFETAGALTVRVTRFDVETRLATAQYAYPVDKAVGTRSGDNGLSRTWWQLTTRTSCPLSVANCTDVQASALPGQRWRCRGCRWRGPR